MTPILIILMLTGTAVTVIGGVLANWLDRPGWATPGRVMLALALIVLATAAVGLAVEDAREQPTTVTTDDPTTSPTVQVPPSVTPSRGASKSTFLTKAEKVCKDNRSGVTTAMPDRASAPEDFGAWLTEITTGNQRVLDAIAALDRPAADRDTLTDLFAQRTRANDVFFQSADAFTIGRSVTGEQFLNSAITIEAAYRDEAKGYGFRICVGSDTPGR